MEKLCCFLSGLKMTVLAMFFLIISTVFMFLNNDFFTYFAWVSAIISGIPIFYWGVKTLLFKRKMTASLLISIAMVAAILTNEVFAAAEVACIMALGGILEDLTIDKAKQGIAKLLNLTPKTARLVKNNNEQILEAKFIKKGDIIRVLAGEDIPLDGVIINGETSVNQSVITGEATPVDKTKGDSVYSGSINCFGVVDIEVTADYKNSSIQKLINLVKEAENKKAPTQRIVDRWASISIPLAVLFAAIVYFVTGEISRAVTILVVFCPCSLVLATPTSIMAAIGQATKRGIVVKTGAALEEIGKCTTYAFDKTGTLTKGKLTVCDIQTTSKTTSDDILYYAASSELKSEHPIGHAIVEFARVKNFYLRETTEFKMFSGRGIYAVLENRKILVGNENFMENNDIYLSEDIKNLIENKRNDGKITLIVAADSEAKGIIALNDTIRESSKQALNNLTNNETILLTGDNSKTADYVAKKIGIDKVFSNLLPEDKAKTIEKMQKEGKKICMVGDGVNDAIALKVADVGISMGTFGSDIAIESSDIIITGDDLSKIPYLKRLSKLCIKTIKTNITISMLINLISLTMSTFGLLIPITGAIVHNIASLIVVTNAALLYERKIN